MVSKSEEIEMKLKELDKLLEEKKISHEKYLDLKIKLELQIKGKAVKVAKEVTKPKILNVICPNCGNPQREVKEGIEEFNCEMCGKLIKIFDATKEAEKLLKKLPGMMENVALERLFIEPEKFKIEASLQKEMARKFLKEKLDDTLKENLLDDCFANLYDSHGFRFLCTVKGVFELRTGSIPLSKVKNTSNAFVIVPIDKENRYNDESLSFWSEKELDLLVKGIKQIISSKKEKPQLIFPWDDTKGLEIRANECLNIVKLLNEFANLLILVSVYVNPDEKVAFFIPQEMAPSKLEMKLFKEADIPPEVWEENEELEKKGKEIFSSFTTMCWANFYKGLASYAQAYGKLLLLKKENIEKSTPLNKLPISEVINNFENASEAFKRASENSDEKRKYYLDFYSNVCKAFVDALRQKLEDRKLKEVEREKRDLTDVEENIIGINEGKAITYLEQGYFAGNIEQKYLERGLKVWKNQRVKGLARIIEGPRFLFYVDVLMIKDIIPKL
jgi:ribosomal protein S27E